jgi:MerR family mercuric resistance operon transcriptional regulator
MSRSYTIAGLAAAGGVHVETVRYYQRLKLLPEPAKPPGGIRRYTESDADRLRFIKRAQNMGFALTEVASLLALQQRVSCHATRELAAAKLRLLDARIRELRGLRKELARLVAACDTNTHDDTCPVLERLDPLRGPPEPVRTRAAR